MFDKLYDKVGIDKVYHFTISGFITALLYIAIQDVIIASGIALLVGASKELYYDWYLGKGNHEWMDMAANAIGVASTSLFIVIVEYFRV